MATKDGIGETTVRHLSALAYLWVSDPDMRGDDARFFDMTSGVSLYTTYRTMETVMPVCNVLSDLTELPRSSSGNGTPLDAQVVVGATPYFLHMRYICVAYQRILSSISANQAASDAVASYIVDKFIELCRFMRRSAASYKSIFLKPFSFQMAMRMRQNRLGHLVFSTLFI
jgi:hypothetical protein